MTKIIKTLSLMAACLLLPQTQAAMITNGNFADSCSLDGWHKDTDGAGDLSGFGGRDFSLNGASPNCGAMINVDYQDTDVFFANTLFQELDLTGASDSSFLLSIDFSVSSELSSESGNFIADYFAIGLNDGFGNYFNENGLAGYLVAPVDIDGFSSFNLSFELDSAFANQTNWFLDFQLGIGANANGDIDGGGSTLAIDSVSLAEVRAQIPSEVPEPSTLALFALGLAGLVRANINSKSGNHYRKQVT